MFYKAEVSSTIEMLQVKFIMRSLQLFRSALNPNLGWRSHLLDSDASNRVFNEGARVYHLQSIFLSFGQSATTYETALARFMMIFSITASDEDSIKCLRPCLQILITYSICTSDVSWVTRNDLIDLEKAAADLKALLDRPYNPPSDRISVDECLNLAFLLERHAKIRLLRVSIIKKLSILASVIQGSDILELYNPSNVQHTSHAAKLLEKLTPEHHSTSLAFSLVMNPFPVSRSSELGCDNGVIDENTPLL